MIIALSTLQNAAAWAAIIAPISGVAALIGKVLARKIDEVGDHLSRQDGMLQDHGERLARLEGPRPRRS
jgi:hypothetical protein